MDPLHKWRLNLNNNTPTSLASHSCENSFVLKHECEAKDVPSIVIGMQASFMQRVYFESYDVISSCGFLEKQLKN